MPQINQRLDVNGSNDKPFPQERNFVLNPDIDGTSIVKSRQDEVVTADSLKEPFGQAKYAVRGLGPSIYEDRSRNTADDEAACRVSDGGEAAPDNYRALGEDDNS